MSDSNDDGAGEKPKRRRAARAAAKAPARKPRAKPKLETEPPPPEPTEQPMHLHKPKPIHNWRELATEFGVIVLGILTALGLEQAIESWHANEKTEEARQAINSELRSNLARATVLLATGDCSERQFAALSDAIGDGDQAKVRRQVDALRLTEATAWSDSAWRTAVASNASERFSENERRYYPIAHEVLTVINNLQRGYMDAYGRLRSVSQSGLSRSGLAASAELSYMAEMSSKRRDMQRAAEALVPLAKGRLGLEISQADIDLLPNKGQVADCEAAAAALGPED